VTISERGDMVTSEIAPGILASSPPWVLWQVSAALPAATVNNRITRDCVKLSEVGVPSGGQRIDPRQTQLSHRYASDSRNAAENGGAKRPMSICGAKNCCPSRRHLVLTGSTPMWWRNCARSVVRSVGRRKSRLNHRFWPRAHLRNALHTLARVVPKSLRVPKCFDFE
jgi:hypothetical protein